MALNLHLLRIFARVAECGSFSRAAVALYVSQPAVSKAVQQLEQQVGARLIDRTRHEIALTEAGGVLFQHAQQLFAVERAAETALEQLRGLERGHLALGASNTIGTYLLPSLMGSFHQSYPGVRLSLEIANTQQVLDHLRTHPLDLAFVEGPVKEADFAVSHWRSDRLVCIAAPGHRLTGQTGVTFEMLAAEPYVQREHGSGTREVIEGLFAERGLSVNVAIELGSNQAVKQAVSAGLGISIVSESTLSLELAARTLAVIAVEGFDFSRSLWHVTAREKPLSPAATAFSALALDRQPTA